MSDKQDGTPQSVHAANYASAVARALEWLGDRYLLAKPINAHVRPPRPLSAIEHRVSTFSVR
jgi:hypothetical protein